MVFYASAIVSTLNGPVTQTTFDILLQSKCSTWKNNFALMGNNNIKMTATFQPTCNVGKLVKMAFNGMYEMPRKSIFINTRSLHVQDSLANLNDHQYILSTVYHLLFNIKYYECSLEKFVIYTYLTLHLQRKFCTSKSCIDFCQHFADTVVTKNKSGGKKNENIDSKCNLHRLCYDSIVSIFELIESLPLKEYLERLLEQHDKTNVNGDVFSPLANFINCTKQIDGDFIQVLLFLKQRLKKCGIKDKQSDIWDLIKTNINSLSHLCSLDAKAVALLEEKTTESDTSLNVSVFGSYKFTCASIVEACIKFQNQLCQDFYQFKQEIVDAFTCAYKNINKDIQFKQTIGYDYQFWQHWKTNTGKLNSVPSGMSFELLEYVIYGITKSLSNADYDYIFNSCINLAVNHNWKCTASNYGKKYSLEDDFAELMGLVYGNVVTMLTLSQCTPNISKEENRKDGLHKLPQLLKNTFIESKVAEDGSCIPLEKPNPWPLLPDSRVWEAASRWQNQTLHTSVPPILVSLCKICGQHQQQLNKKYLRCVAVDKDYAKEECASNFLNDKTEQLPMPSVQQLEANVAEYDKYREKVQNINMGITHDEQRFNVLRGVSVDILDNFRDSQNHSLHALQVYGNEMMKVKEQRQDCWNKNISMALRDCFSLWNKVQHYFGGQSKLPVSGNTQTVAAFGLAGPNPFQKGNDGNLMQVNDDNFAGDEDDSDNDREVDSDSNELQHVGCGDWSKMVEYHEKHGSNALESILEFVRSNLNENIVPVNGKAQVYLLQPFCKVIQEGCGRRFENLYQLLQQNYSDLKHNVIKSMLLDIIKCILVFKVDRNFPLYVTNFVALTWRILIFSPTQQEKYYSLCMFNNILCL